MPRRFRPALTALIALHTLWTPSMARAQTPAALGRRAAPQIYAAAIERARPLIEAMMMESKTPGMSVAVGIGGGIVWAEGFGYADVEHRVPVWPETKFRIGSVSKSLTAAAVARLHEEGGLDLDAPVQRYVPSFPEKRWPITTRQLAGHLAGVRHYRGDEFLSSRRYDTVGAGLEIFKDDSLLFEPGSRYSYSSYGWNLISAVVEGASGQEFLAFMRASVFDPLALQSTVADYPDSIIPHRTRFYQRMAGGQVVNAPYVDNSYKWAGGGFLSTPSDLVRFGLAHLDGGFLRRATLDLLFTSQRTLEGVETGYGIGWRINRDREGRRIVSHSGGSVGGRTHLLVFPEERVAIAMVGNLSEAPLGFNEVYTVAEGFLAPSAEASVASASDRAGVYEVRAESAGQQVTSGTIWLVGSPGHYWGRVSLGERSARIVQSAEQSDHLRLIAVDERGGLVSLWLEFRADGVAGEWAAAGRRGRLTGRRAR